LRTKAFFFRKKFLHYIVGVSRGGAIAKPAARMLLFHSVKLMNIKVEQVDFAKLDTEKVSLVVDICDNTVFNVSEGTYKFHTDDLRQSPLYCPLSTGEYRSMLWLEITEFLPVYLERQATNSSRTTRLGRYFCNLVSIAKRSKEVDIKLLYLGNQEQAEMLARCIQYLATQI